MRSQWLSLSDRELLDQCEVDTYRASGPGGQKRNKTSSAVRLRHKPSGLMVISEESRSQHENKARALRRLRQKMCLELREPVSVTNKSLSLAIGQRDVRFWPTVALVLDMLDAAAGQVRVSAEQMGVSTGKLIDFLQSDSRIWIQANRLRQQHRLHPLKST